MATVFIQFIGVTSGKFGASDKDLNEMLERSGGSGLYVTPAVQGNHVCAQKAVCRTKTKSDPGKVALM